MKFTSKTCCMLTWPQVGTIVNGEIRAIIGRPVSCKMWPEDIDFWGGEFAEPISLVELCIVLQAVNSSFEEWEAALPDEGGTEISGIGWELGEALIRRNLNISWVHTLPTEDGLWLVDVTEAQRTAEDMESIGGIRLRFSDLKSKDELFNFFQEGACDHATLMEFCEDYQKRYGDDLCWPYILAEGNHLGQFLVLVKEGVLSLPYDDFDSEKHELFSLEGARLLSSDEITDLGDNWERFSDALLGAMVDMALYLDRAKEGEV